MKTIKQLSTAQIRELRAYRDHGDHTELWENNAPEHLQFWARDKVIGSLLKRGLLEEGGPTGFQITQAGIDALTTLEAK